MNEIDFLRHEFGESVNEKRRTILAVSFTNDAFTNIELYPCTLELAMEHVKRIEKDGVLVVAEKYHPCAHVGDSMKDVAFRQPPHTIKRIEIMRRRQWKEEDET